VRCLFGNVVAASMIRKFPVASKSLAQNGVEWLLDASAVVLTAGCRNWRAEAGLRRFDMPSTEVELDHRHESLDGVVNFGHRE